MKRVLIIPALTAGGAERVLSIMANHWAAAGMELTLLTLDDGTAPPFFELHPGIRHRPLDLLSVSAHPVDALINNLRRIRVLRQVLREESPDVVISFLDSTNVLTLMASRGLKWPVVVTEHIDPAQYPLKPVWVMLRHWVYPWADRVVVLTERALEYFPPSLRPRCRVLPNPVPALGAKSSGGAQRLLAMGRLVEQKGFDILLEAFARLYEDFPDWTLTVIGDGPQSYALRGLAERLGISQRVLWPGVVQHAETVLLEADVFVLSSRYEGFPMALCEAMAAGLAVVAADCPTGPGEIIQHDVNGWLVAADNPEALATGLRHLMRSSAERQRLGRAASEITNRYGVNTVMAQWEHLLGEL
ncbi:MAG: glycosyltransferase family 4 protein [Methylococcaceae bacterium]